MSHSPNWRPFLREFWRFDRKASLLAVGLNLASALLEGMGLLMLLPLLAVAGIIDAPAGAILSLPVPQVIREALQSTSQNQRLLLVLGGYVALVALQAGLAYARELHNQRLRLRFVDHLRNGFFGSLANSRWRFLSRYHGSEFASVLTTDIQRTGQGAYFLLHMFSQLALLPVYIAVACHLSVPATVTALLTGAALWWLLRKSRNAAENSGQVLSKANRDVFNVIQEFLAALKLIKIHAEEQPYRRQFDQTITQLREQQLEFQRVSSRAQASFRIGSAAALALLLFGSLAYLQLSTPALLVLIAVFSRMLPQVSQLHTGLQQLTHMAPAFENWNQWMQRCAIEQDPPEIDADRSPMTTGIRFDGVLFRHPEGGQRLSAPNTLIPVHRTTAIIGQSGAGKTTFLDLLCGLNAPDEGSIWIDDMALASRSGWRHQLAYVPQETAILDGTIRENLTWGTPHLNDELMMAALDQAAAGNFVRALPKQLDTWVGERGVRLSGGERQRLALARALLRRPQLLILDEATSALDREHQQVILQALRDLHGLMTVLIVTHRHEEISSLLDGVVRIEAGRVSQWQPLPTNTQVLRSA